MHANDKNFLIVTASIGAGHNRAAEAIESEIRLKHPNAQIHIADFMSTKTAYLNGFLKEAYLKMLSYVPDMYEFLYSFTSGRLRGFSVQSLLALAMKSDMETLINRWKADVVVCTHPFPCAAAAYLKKNNQAQITLVGVITDFAIHRLWVYKEVDLYFVGNRQTGAELAKKGIESWKIHDTGIPIGRSFCAKYNRSELFKKFELNAASPVLLIMGGGLGLGGVKIALNSLENIGRSVQILVVTGENIPLWTDLKEHAESSKHKIQVFGFSKRVQELMAVSTLLISKPGALTISEALAMELPMLLNEPIPGQEEENAAYIETTGAAIWIKDSAKIADVVEEILRRPEGLAKMRERAQEYKKPDAAQEIVSRIDAHLDKTCGGIVAGM